MYLKKLELFGFKSFADKTEFNFPRNVTAIVGPNGCGKSNVVDAFKWIFGEQSAKGLRGGEMKDVIFNGTQTRKATGFAEVTVVFDNTDRALDIDYSEVGITRRLFRSGESEYLINKQKCRLRDIKELLLDTGLGASSYSILEQGKIDVLLQSSTLDRRIIFEEAAGISKYRVKKAESLRSLVRTSENLARLRDIFDEVEKRIHRLKIQAGKARHYQEYSDRLKKLRVGAAFEDYQVLIQERVALSCRRFFADHGISVSEELAGRLKAGLDRQRAIREDRLGGLTRLREHLNEARTRRERTHERIEQDRRRLSEMEDERARRVEELAAGEQVRNRFLVDLERERSERERALEAIGEQRTLLRQRVEEQEAHLKSLEEISRDLDRRRESIVEMLQERSRVGNRLVQLASELKGLASRRERTALALEVARGEVEKSEAARQALERELEGLREELLAIDQHRLELDGKSGSLRDEFTAVEEKVVELAGGVQDRRSRIDVLKSFEESFEGIGGGVQAILSQPERCPVAGEIRGLVADLLRVEHRHARAVEAVLGERAQSLVVETQEGGLALLGWSRDEGAGGVEVLALDRIGADPESAGESFDQVYPDFLAEGGVIGLLRHQVKAPIEYRELVDVLLEGVILVEDLPTAVALSRNGLRPYRLVTLDGALVEPWGAMSLSGLGSRGGIISRRSEMAELEEQMEAISQDHVAVRQEREKLTTALQELELQKRKSAETREAVNLKIGAAEGHLAQVARERDQALREVRVAESELGEIGEMVTSLEAERGNVELEVTSLDRRREAEERSLLEGENEEVRARQKSRVLGEAVTEIKVRLAEAEEREEGFQKSLGQLEESLREHQKREEALGSQIEQLRGRQVETTRDLEESEEALKEIHSREETLGSEVRSAETEDREFAEIEEGFSAEHERVRGLIDESRTARESLNLREQEGKLKQNGLVERMVEEYGVDISAPSAKKAEPGSDGESPVLPLDDPEWDRELAEKEIPQLKEKLRRLGNVNLEALDELEELQERHEFMVTQRDDLLKAERDLKEIIAQINHTSRELFLSTFETVQRHFGEIFRKCFGGGMAELVLEENADVLEAGIEIIARPPGKKLTSLSLMSGGEKTMTTIALLFALFRSRPSPFCVLDEVDAALDENNIRRFILILRDFLKKSQFIMITHNKITMAEAGSLFGVTMEERGVSKRVAVEFNSVDSHLSRSGVASNSGDGVPGMSDESAEI